MRRDARATPSILAFVLIGSSPACGTGGGASAPTEPGVPMQGAGGVGAGGSAPFPASSGGSIGTGGAAGTPTFMIPIPVTESCAQAAYQSTLLPTNLLFMVDRSGSMNCNLPPVTDSVACEQTATTADVTKPTKWSVITSAMSNSIQALAALPGTSMGLSLFSVDDECGVRSAPTIGLAALSTAQVDALTNTLRGEAPRGGTPLIGSIVLGYKYLHQTARAPGNRFLVVVTDGADSCLSRYAQEGVTGDVMARLLDTEIPKAVSVNIRTFVIGAPGSESTRGVLSRIAFAGGTATRPDCDYTSADPAPGTACHFDMTATSDFAVDLSAALQAITGDSAGVCEFEVPKPTDSTAVDPTKVNVDYYKAGDPSDASRVQLYRDDTKPCDAGANGWQYTPDQSKIRICGSVCDDVKADGQAKVIVSLGCEQRVIH
jgi:hypothetical protein